MFTKIKGLLAKVIGLNRLQHQLQSDLRNIQSEISTLKRFIGSDMNNVTDQTVERLDRLVQQRLDEKLNFYFRWRLPLQLAKGSETYLHTNDGHRVYADTNEPFMTLHLLEHGEWETPVRRVLNQLLKPGSTFVDVGANIGLHSLYASLIVGKAGSVIALEPHPLTRSILNRNLEVNGLLELVKSLPYAASNEDDKEAKFEYFNEHPAMSGLRVSPEVLNKFNGTVNIIEVTTITIDSLLIRQEVSPDLIKIDVEGFEYSVLQGCYQTIEKYPKVHFLIEYERSMARAVMNRDVGFEISEFFSSRNFRVFKVQADCLMPLTYAQFVLEERGDYVFSRDNLQ
jgi:FkbM family methyltransferase